MPRGKSKRPSRNPDIPYPGRTWYSSQWCTPEQVESIRDRKRRYAQTRVDYRKNMRNWIRQKRYGVTPEQWSQMLVEWDGLCAICLTEPATDVDHDHETGLPRGPLCGPCNRALGIFKDDIKVLMSAQRYLEEFPSA